MNNYQYQMSNIKLTNKDSISLYWKLVFIGSIGLFATERSAHG